MLENTVIAKKIYKYTLLAFLAFVLLGSIIYLLDFYFLFSINLLEPLFNGLSVIFAKLLLLLSIPFVLFILVNGNYYLIELYATKMYPDVL
ncbi:MAG: hypothetical protein EOP34_02260 [Rickettsiales bacterium]|nr:MAG: hypothetical protein EOP34_02260 [Rickettsiales bacterium]